MSAQSRDLTARELRRFERKAAREYLHAICRYSPCWELRRRPCLTCVGRVLDGTFRRNRAALATRRTTK